MQPGGLRFKSFKLLKCQLRVYCIIIDVHCITIYVAAIDIVLHVWDGTQYDTVLYMLCSICMCCNRLYYDMYSTHGIIHGIVDQVYMCNIQCIM